MNKKLTILITGTSRGIGNALAEYLLVQGHLVIGCSRGQSTINYANYSHRSIQLEDEGSVLELMAFVRKEYQKLDVLVNCAAINPMIMTAALLPTSIMKEVYAVNLFAPMLLCREAIKLMSRKKFGRIINLGSMATKHEVAGEALYTSSKSALIAYTRVIAKEIYGLGITANVVAPAVIKTDLSEKINQLALSEVLKRNAIPAYGSFDDVNHTVEFLLSENSSSITGQIIYLGGV
jgi:3-oxoacyl-[acyl-carrier protein] reductase